jgi:hypothetical protein
MSGRTKATQAGEILSLKVRPGDYAAPGGDPLLLLGDTSHLRVRMDVDERDVGELRLGAPAYVTADTYGGTRFGGSVVEIGHRMGRKNVRTDDPTERIDTKILEVVIELAEPAGASGDRLIPGQRVMAYVDRAG